MSLKAQELGRLSRLYLTRIPKSVVGQFIKKFSKWVDTNGLSWSCKRLKALKLDYIRFLAGLKPVSGVRRSRKNPLLPSGVFGTLYKLPKRYQKDVFWILNAYTMFCPELTDEDINDVVLHIEEASIVPERYGERILQAGTRADIIGKMNKLPEVKPLVTLYVKPNKTAPSFPVDMMLRLKEQGIQLERAFTMNFARYKGTESFDDELALYMLNRHLYKQIPSAGWILNDFERGLDLSKFEVIQHSSTMMRHWSGHINFVTDKGKHRHVAAPFRYEQLLLRPLGEWLYRQLQSMPWDFTFRQTEAFPMIQKHLGKGKMVASVDLTKATDHIPLSDQAEMLRFCLDKEFHGYTYLWELISQGMWILMKDSQTPVGAVRWKVGQPLGLFPSFGAFALWHGLTLKALLNQKKWNEEFFVLGDDVVITDPVLADRYVEYMNHREIPISPSKTLSSSFIAEFAGHLIFSDRVWRSISWDFNPKNLIWLGEAFGPKVLDFIHATDRKLLRTFGDLPSPIGCNWFSSKPYSEKLNLIDLLLGDRLEFVSYGNPKRIVERNLSVIPKEIQTDEVQIILNECDRNTRRVLGEVPDINSIPDFLIPAHGPVPTLSKSSYNYNERDWLQSLHERYHALTTGSSSPPAVGNEITDSD